VQHKVVGVASAAEPDAWPPLGEQVPLLAVGAVVSCSPWMVTPTVAQPPNARGVSVPPQAPVFTLKAST